ncbi:hypothetical protein C820_001101 [Clostridium sp. MD294]|nr:hypothetical protein C820_001101 [Clostridium sp. MD294]
MKKGVGEKGDTMEKKEEENMEKIKLISQLMGQEMPKEAEVLKMMEMAKKMQQFLGTEEIVHNTDKKENFAKAKTTLTQKEEGMIFARTKEESIIYASIPFLDREYQKYLYVVVRLLEMKRVLQEQWGETLEIRSRTKDNIKVRRRNLLQALRPYLTKEEKQNIDFVVKAIDMKNIMEWKEEML